MVEKLCNCECFSSSLASRFYWLSKWSTFLKNDYLDFLSESKNRCVQILVAPTTYELAECEPSSSTQRNIRTPSITVHEFVRFCAVLIDRDNVRQTRIASGTDLCRAY